MKSLSILIPVFNEENTVIYLLKKVKEQGKGNVSLEVRVVDDCSTDSSLKILEKLASKPETENQNQQVSWGSHQRSDLRRRS